MLDAGALIAFERGDVAMAARIAVARANADAVRTVTPVVAQVWRDERGRQVRLARLVAGVDAIAPSVDMAKAAGVLCGRTGTSDVVDALLAGVAGDGDVVVTSDPHDLSLLLRTRRVRAIVVTV